MRQSQKKARLLDSLAFLHSGIFYKIMHNPHSIPVNYIIFAAHYTLSVRKIV